jgi:hypothetical protein
MVRVSREGELRLGTLTRNEERKREVIMSKPETQPPSLGVIDEVDAVGLKVTVLKAAMELDVFTTISKGHVTLEEIATVLQCSMRGMRVLLDALCPL